MPDISAVIPYDAVSAVGGTVKVSGGTFTGTGIFGAGLRKGGSWDSTVQISGGTFSGTRNSVLNSRTGETVADLLGDGYAFKQDGAWADASGNSLTGNVTVEKAPVRITAQPQAATITYGESVTLSVTAQATGSDTNITYQWYQAGENSDTAVTGATAASYTASGLGAGTYQYYCAVTCDSYTVRSETVTVTVAKKTVTPTITGTTSKTYDGKTDAPADLSIILTGGVTGDDVTATATGYAYDNANAGENKTITASGITLAGGSKDNYTLSSTTATITGTITKSQPTIAFASGYDPGKTYDGQTIPNPTEANLTISGAAFKDVTFEWSATPKDAGTYTLTASIPVTNNTEAASATLTVTISPKAVTPTITITPDSYKYTGNAIHPSGSAVKVMDGDTVIPDSEYTLSYGENTQVGQGSVTVTDKENGNYKIAQTTETFTITKANQAPLTITGAPGSVTYGDTFQLSVSGGSGTGAISWAASGATVDNTGKVTITRAGTVTITAVKAGDSNYVGSEGQIMLDVSKKTLTVSSVDTQNRQYDGTSTVKVTSVMLDGIVGSDAVSVSTANLSGTLNGSNVGHYTAVTLPALTLTGEKADNYTLTRPAGAVSTSVTISKADAPTVKGGAMTVSNDLERTYSYSLDQLLPALTGGQTFGTVTYSLGTVSLLGDYYTTGAAVTGDKLSLPINR